MAASLGACLQTDRQTDRQTDSTWMEHLVHSHHGFDVRLRKGKRPSQVGFLGLGGVYRCVRVRASLPRQCVYFRVLAMEDRAS
jgi:hypothetical protein